MVVAESSIPVSSLVQEFNKIGKSKFETEKSLIIECEIEIKGIVKKVVKVKFNRLDLFLGRTMRTVSKIQWNLYSTMQNYSGEFRVSDLRWHSCQVYRATARPISCNFWVFYSTLRHPKYYLGLQPSFREMTISGFQVKT